MASSVTDEDELANVRAREVLTAVHAARPVLDLEQARTLCRPFQPGHWTDDQEQQAAIEAGASEDVRDFNDAFDNIPRTAFKKLLTLSKACMRIFRMSPLEVFSPDCGINFRRGAPGRADHSTEHRLVWAQSTLGQLHPIMLHPLFAGKNSPAFLVMALQFTVICRTRDTRPWSVPLLGIPQMDTLRDLFHHVTTSEDGTASHSVAPYELLRNFCARIPPEQVTAEVSLLLEVFNIVMSRKIAGTLATANQHGVMQYEVYVADIEAIAKAIDDVQPPQVSVKVASDIWGGLPGNRGRFTGQPDSGTIIEILKLSYKHLTTQRLLRDRSLPVQHGSTANDQVLQSDPPLNQSINMAHEESFAPPSSPPPLVVHEESFEPPPSQPAINQKLDGVPSDHFGSVEGSPVAQSADTQNVMEVQTAHMDRNVHSHIRGEEHSLSEVVADHLTIHGWTHDPTSCPIWEAKMLEARKASSGKPYTKDRDMAANVLVDVLRHLGKLQAHGTQSSDEFFTLARSLEERNPLLRYLQPQSKGLPSKDEIIQLLCPDSGLAGKTILDLIQCDLMKSTLWTLPHFHLLTSPLSMAAAHRGGFYLTDNPEQTARQIETTTTPFIEWDCSKGLEDVIEALLVPKVASDGRITACIGNRPWILHVTVKEASVDMTPPRQLEMWIGAYTAGGAFHPKRNRQHYMLVGVVIVSCDGTHSTLLYGPPGINLNADYASDGPSSSSLRKGDSCLLMYTRSPLPTTEDIGGQCDIMSTPRNSDEMLAESAAFLAAKGDGSSRRPAPSEPNAGPKGGKRKSENVPRYKGGYKGLRRSQDWNQ